VVRTGVSPFTAVTLTVLALLAILMIARHTSKDFEGRQPPEELLGGSGEISSLADARVWDFPDWAVRQQRGHLALAASAAAIVLYVGEARFDQVLGVLVGTQVLLLAVFGVVSAIDRIRLGTDAWRAGIGPWGASAVAVGMSHGGWSAAMEVGRWLGPMPGVAGDTEQRVFAAAAAGAATTAVAGGLVLIWLLAKPEQVTDLEPPGGDRDRRRIGRARSIARLLGYLGVVLLPAGLAFFLVATVDVAGSLLVGWPDRDGSVLTAWEPVRVLVAWAGRATIAGLVVGVLAMLVARRYPTVAAKVGILWDVLAFLPRWHHRFAVRCYAERAVPELQIYLLEARDQGTSVVVSAHSQGTVLAVAALAPLPPPAGSSTVSDISLVTFGSPLTDLHARFFPYWFGRDDLVPSLAERLRAWHNLYRHTDYIGRRIQGVSSRVCNDPATPDDLDDADPDTLFDDETRRQPWGPLLRHSGYRRESAVAASVATEVNNLLSSGAAGPTSS